jgi:hypothetical protein
MDKNLKRLELAEQILSELAREAIEERDRRKRQHLKRQSSR